MMTRGYFLAALLASATFAMNPVPAVAQPASEIMVQDAWIMKAPPAVKMHAGYLTLYNQGDAARALIAVTSPSFGNVEMHLSREVDGVASMQHVSQVEIAAGAVVTFRPGGLHLMLMAPRSSLSDTPEVVLQLTFDDGSEIKTRAGLRKHPPQEVGADAGS